MDRDLGSEEEGSLGLPLRRSSKELFPGLVKKY